MKSDSDKAIFILARGGSKRIKDKNLTRVGGLTLLERAVYTALSVPGSETYVSSEDPKILSTAVGAGAYIINRPRCLAADDTPSIDAVLHGMDLLTKEYNQIILMQCTSPFVSRESVARAAYLSKKSGRPVFAAVRCPKILWAWTSDAPVFPGFQGRRSQDLPPVFLPAGAFYVATPTQLREHGTFFAPGAQPFEISETEGIDIDTEEDLCKAEALCQAQPWVDPLIKQPVLLRI